MSVWQLDEDLWFPDPYTGEDSGLVAVGGDLSVERLLLAYDNGFFPWYSFNLDSEPLWYCPLQRYVIFPDEIHVSHSMRQLVKQRKYEVTVNRNFDGVIRGCQTAQGRDNDLQAWLGPDIIEAYTRLHRLGYAASVEVWEQQRLGTAKARGWPLWCHHAQGLHWRKHVLVGAQCFKVSVDCLGKGDGERRWLLHRLPVRDSPFQVHGRPLHLLQGIHGNTTRYGSWFESRTERLN